MKKLFFILFFGALYFGVNAQSWNLMGNAGTNPPTNYIGTSDCQPLVFKTANKERMFLCKDGTSLGIGTSNPLATLHLFNPGRSALCNGKEPEKLGIGLRLLQLTTVTATSGVNASIDFSNNFYLTQSENANFTIEGPGGGLTIAPDGNIGVGTDIPQAKLDVAGSLRSQSANITGALTAQTATVTGNTYLMGKVLIGTTTPQKPKLYVEGDIRTTNLWVDFQTNKDWEYGAGIYVNRNLTKALVVTNTIPPSKEVFVVYGNGVVSTKKIFAEKVTITMDAMNSYWYDHVFYPEYNLRPLSEVEHFIKQNHHLPEIPSAKEVMENGLDLSEMQGKLLLKIEELTLYLLQQNEKITDLQNQINKLNK